jgi:hypothetical protein
MTHNGHERADGDLARRDCYAKCVAQANLSGRSDAHRPRITIPSKPAKLHTASQHLCADVASDVISAFAPIEARPAENSSATRLRYQFCTKDRKKTCAGVRHLAIAPISLVRCPLAVDLEIRARAASSLAVSACPPKSAPSMVARAVSPTSAATSTIFAVATTGNFIVTALAAASGDGSASAEPFERGVRYLSGLTDVSTNRENGTHPTTADNSDSFPRLQTSLVEGADEALWPHSLKSET